MGVAPLSIYLFWLVTGVLFIKCLSKDAQNQKSALVNCQLNHTS